MAFLNMSMKNDLFNTPLPNLFIDKYMPAANAIFVIVYIFGFRHCFHGSKDINTGDMAQSLNILESDVVNAWRYWEKQRLVNIHTQDENLMGIEFLQIPAMEEQEKPVRNKPEKKPRKVILETRPDYSVEELELHKTQSTQIDSLFSAAEQYLGKLLKYNDLNMIFSFHDWLGLPVLVVEKLLCYCGGNGHTNMNYIETVALDWADKQIRSVEEADAYIRTFNTEYREILKAFGNSGRNPTPKEIEFMEKWLREYETPLNIILEACDKTIMAIGKANFKYADKMLAEWHKSGITTLEDIQKSEDAFYQTKQAKAEKTPAGQKSGVKKNRFVNFEGRKWDYAEMEKLETEYLDNIVKGK